MEPALILVPVFFVLVFSFAIGCRVIAGTWNHERIRTYIENKGGKMINIVWTPFGPGWFTEQTNAIYEIDYYDRDGNHRRAHCKTSMFSGVYLHNDRLISIAKESREGPMSLEEENRRLKEENELLRNEIETFKRNRF